MKEVVRNEILKLLEAGIIYPIANNQWVSPVHYDPKKGGITVVPNDKDELIPQRIVTGYRMVIDFRKSRRPSGLRKTTNPDNSLAHRTTWLRSDFLKEVQMGWDSLENINEPHKSEAKRS